MCDTVNNHREQSQAPRPTDCEEALSQDVTRHTQLPHPPEWLKLDLEAGGVMEAPVGGHANAKAIGIPLGCRLARHSYVWSISPCSDHSLVQQKRRVECARNSVKGRDRQNPNVHTGSGGLIMLCSENLLQCGKEMTARSRGNDLRTRYCTAKGTTGTYRPQIPFIRNSNAGKSSLRGLK